MYTNRKRSENDQYNETSNHIQMKGGCGSGAGTPGAGGTRRCRRTLSFVYGLMSHCIDRFHFVFYLYTFHFMLPMCIRLIFLFLHIFMFFILFIFHVFIFFPQVHLGVPGTTTVNYVLPLQMEHCHFMSFKKKRFASMPWASDLITSILS